MMYKKIIILLKTIMLLQSLSCDCGISGQSVTFRRIDSSHGLPHNTVFCISQDSNGFMWFGTRFGICRYDGNNFVTFNSSNSNIKNNIVRDILQVNDSTLYVATEAELLMISLQSGAITPIFFNNADFNPVILDLEMDQNNNIWIATAGNGVFLIKEGNLIHYPQPRYATNILCYLDEVLIAANTPGQEGIYILNREENKFEKKLNIHAMVIIHADNFFWAGTQGNGLVKIDTQGNILSQHKLGDNRNENIVRDIIPYKKDLLVATEGGLFMFDRDKGTYIHYYYDPNNQYSISDNALYALFQDKEEGVWIGSYFRGVSYLSPIRNLFVSSTVNHINNQYCGAAVSAFFELDSNTTIIATEDKGLCYYHPEKYLFDRFEAQASLSYNNIHDICLDSIGRLWIGTYLHGIDIYDPKKQSFQHIDTENFNIHSNSVYRIYRDSRNRIHIGTTMGASTYYPSGKLEKHEITRFGIIRDIFEDVTGHIWFISMNRGIFKYVPKSGKWGEYNQENGKIPTNKCTCMRADEKGKLWVGTEGYGLLQYNEFEDSFNVVNTSHGLNDNYIFSIECAEDDIWIGTTRGLSRFTPKTGLCKTYTKEDGLTSIYFNYNASRKMASGELYFGTVNGFIRFNPLHEKYNKYVPNGFITGISASGRTKEIVYSENRIGVLNNEKNYLQLKHSQNNIIIHISSLSYINPTKNGYRYILEGFDAVWQEDINIQKVEYNNLPPGKYRFILYVSNNDGVWASRPTSLNIVILPPFWKNNLAKVLYFFFLITSIIILIIYIKQREEVKHKKKIDEYEKELNESKINFFTNLAHEIKTPLSLIKAPVEILKADSSFPQHLKQYLQTIDRNSRWLEDTVSELLEFRKLEEKKYTLHFVKVDLVELLQELYNRFLPYSKLRHIRFDFFCKEESLPADVDPKAIIKIMSNLIINAFKYTTDRVIICLRYRPKSESILITVHDNGPGIAQQHIQSVFEPFTQINREGGKFKGVGLGLALTRSLVELHGGDISVSSYYGKWCNFHVRLPQFNIQVEDNSDIESMNDSDFNGITSLLEINSPKKVVVKKNNTEGKQDREHVLVVEDTPELAQIIIDYFSTYYIVGYANNGIEAVDYIYKQHPDIVISDIIMPGMDGIELVKTIRADYNISHTGIILLTAKTTDEDKLTGLEVGANAYIKKPFSMKELELIVRNLLKIREHLKDMAISGNITIDKNILVSKDQQFLNEFTDFIHKNIDNDQLKIDEIASELNLSRSLLYLKLKKIINMSPNEYIQSVRLNYSKKLLQETDLNIAEIAYKVGFTDPNYFSRSFKQFYGETPTQYRKRKIDIG